MKFQRILIISLLIFLSVIQSGCHKASNEKNKPESVNSNDTLALDSTNTNDSLAEQARNYYIEVEGNRIYTRVDEPPMFPDINSFLTKNLIYPIEALKESLEQTVMASFIVGKDGRVREVKILSKTNSSLNKEATRLVTLMQDWSPGIENGEPVDVRCQLPIRFSLDPVRTE